MKTQESEAPNKGGRPQWQPTDEQRREAEIYVAAGMSEDDIARAFGISFPTVRLHLAEELATGRAKRRAAVLRLLWKSAEGGNVSAQKYLETMTAIAATSREEMARRVPAAGKKEQAILDAGNPEQGSTLGDLMAQRQGLKPN